VEDASDFHSRHVLTPRVFDALRRSVAQTAQSPGRAVEAIEADKDHVHLLFFANKKVNCDIINKAGAIFCVIGTVSHINH